MLLLWQKLRRSRLEDLLIPIQFRQKLLPELLSTLILNLQAMQALLFLGLGRKKALQINFFQSMSENAAHCLPVPPLLTNQAGYP